MLVKRKYNQGRFLVRQYMMVWGACDVNTGRVVLQRIPDQTMASLMTCIATFVNENSIILSDGALRHQTNEIIVDLGWLHTIGSITRRAYTLEM